MKKILTFCGAFNPPTLAHIHLAKKAMDETGREGVVFVPSKMSYISEEQKKNYAYTDEQRLQMLQTISLHQSWMEVSDWEIRKEQQPRTYETLCCLRDQGMDPALLCGFDKLAEMEYAWKCVDRILTEFGIVCLERNGQDVEKFLRETPFFHPYLDRVRVVKTESVYQEISSSQAREILLQIRQLREALRSMVPEEIVELL